ncbi:MAG TPA: uroporphyrinogen-III synthase [Balneolaceae bacterium]|nr:uroporphyrinogen-III synthase [Balneolaceae bacterium]
MNKAAILLTANKADCPHFLSRLKEISNLLLHLPLEKYDHFVEGEEGRILAEKMREFVFVVYGNVRNAHHFLQWAEEENRLEECKNRIHLVTDPATSGLLEKYSLPAIMPREFAKGIDVIEFMLRISTEGAVLYPTTDSHTEEIPGLLKELEMPVTEFTVCRERTLTDTELQNYRKNIQASEVETVLFHNRSSVKRIKLAFPDLNLHQTKNIAADRGVAEFMEREKIPVAVTASGTWLSLSDVVLNKYDK